MGDPNEPCALHELTNCTECYPPATTYPRGAVVLDVPPGHYVEIRPGKGVYHHPDCLMAAADWDGAATAKLGARIGRSPDEILQLGLRPAQCCDPPTVRAPRSSAATDNEQKQPKD